jgi:hypothetical protein
MQRFLKGLQHNGKNHLLGKANSVLFLAFIPSTLRKKTVLKLECNPQKNKRFLRTFTCLKHLTSLLLKLYHDPAFIDIQTENPRKHLAPHTTDPLQAPKKAQAPSNQKH